MATETEFEVPDFLEDCDEDTIHQRMLDELPDDIDQTEGGFPWDFTRPTAMIAAELLEFYIPETLKLIFVQWSSGEYLDMLAEAAGVTRKSATYAETTVTITGVAGTVIEAGTVFATAATSSSSSIEFETTEEVTIGEDGTVTVTVRAVTAGTEGNVNAGTITLMSEPVDGVTSVTNTDAATGGTDEEDDDDLRERIIESYSSIGYSYIGNAADYRRWALEVDGIGEAIVIPEWDGPETVKIVCLDANGDAPNDTLLQAVYDYIMSPDDPYERLAPPNVILTVSALEMVYITYSFTISIDSDYDLDTVIESFSEALEEYYETAWDEGEVKYVMVMALLAETDGVLDFSDFLMNDDTENIEIAEDEYPATYSIDAEEES